MGCVHGGSRCWCPCPQSAVLIPCWDWPLIWYNPRTTFVVPECSRNYEAQRKKLMSKWFISIYYTINVLDTSLCLNNPLSLPMTTVSQTDWSQTCFFLHWTSSSWCSYVLLLLVEKGSQKTNLSHKTKFIGVLKRERGDFVHTKDAGIQFKRTLLWRLTHSSWWL